jgi:hypothetical protein
MISSGGPSGTTQSFYSINSTSDLAQVMDISGGTKFSMSMGVASASASTKVSFFEETKTNSQTRTIVSSWSYVDPTKYISGDVTVKPEYQAIAGTAAFRAACGDYLVVGMQKGRWMYGKAQLFVKDTTTMSKLAASGNADVQYATYSAEADASSVKSLAAASSTQEVQIKVTSSGTAMTANTPDQLIDMAAKFPGEAGPKQVYKLTLVPYKELVANWPATDVLAKPTPETMLGEIADAAYALKALDEDTTFMVDNPSLFAMGTTQARRDARVYFHKGRRTYYRKELEQIRNAAVGCDTSWGVKC